MRPGGGRDKGHKWERALASMLRPLFGDLVKRGYQTRDGKEAPDVDGTPYWLECKHGKAVSVWAAMRQAVAATDGRTPIVVAKMDREEPLVVMRLSDWIAQEERRLPKEVVQELVSAE